MRAILACFIIFIIGYHFGKEQFTNSKNSLLVQDTVPENQPTNRSTYQITDVKIDSFPSSQQKDLSLLK